jgi:nickel superoxide dismutase
MFRSALAALIAVTILLSSTSVVYAHCQVPCGIYDDSARFTAMREDATTIAKATGLIVELSGKQDAASAQQLVRWTMTKEDHASHIIKVVAEYFLTQKVKPADPKDKKAYKAYLDVLASCHQVMRAAMTTKQKADAKAVAALNKAIEDMASRFNHSHK